MSFENPQKWHIFGIYKVFPSYLVVIQYFIGCYYIQINLLSTVTIALPVFPVIYLTIFNL